MSHDCLPSIDDVSEEVLLSIVGGQHRDLLCRIAEQPQVHEHGNHVLGLRQVLEKTIEWLTN